MSLPLTCGSDMSPTHLATPLGGYIVIGNVRLRWLGTRRTIALRDFTFLIQPLVYGNDPNIFFKKLLNEIATFAIPSVIVARGLT